MNRTEYERNQHALEELEHGLREAQDALNRSLTELTDVVNQYQRKADSLHPVVHDTAHPGQLDKLVRGIEGWVNGGNPYDPSIQRFVDEDIHEAESALKDAFAEERRDNGVGHIDEDQLERGDWEFDRSRGV